VNERTTAGEQSPEILLPGGDACMPAAPTSYPGGVDGLTTVVVALLGVLVGVGATLAFWWSERAQRRVPPQEAAVLDDGLVRTLAVLRSAGVVLDDADRVVRAGPPAYALGLVREGRLVHAAVREMVADVRRDGVIRDAELDLPLGPVGSGRVLLQVRVAQVTPHLMLVLAEDLTQARRVEAMRRDFVVNISHELKTPVGALALLAETVQDAADDPAAVRRFSERMLVESERLSRLVQEIIELSRLQSSSMDTPTLVDVDGVVAEAVDRARTTATARHVTIEAGSRPGAKVFGDRNLLVTAVRNLLDNAVAYSPGSTRVGVGVEVNGDLVEVAVVDSGIGIAPADQDRIFERFYRVDPARSRDTGGTGLGLSIVKHVATEHGGDVTVWSRPGRGSTFTLRLPLAEEPVHLTGPAVGAAPTGRGLL
jgi:two-component system sensor histidine kinase SenX3